MWILKAFNGVLHAHVRDGNIQELSETGVPCGALSGLLTGDFIAPMAIGLIGEPASTKADHARRDGSDPVSRAATVRDKIDAARRSERIPASYSAGSKCTDRTNCNRQQPKFPPHIAPYGVLVERRILA